VVFRDTLGQELLMLRYLMIQRTIDKYDKFCVPQFWLYWIFWRTVADLNPVVC